MMDATQAALAKRLDQLNRTLGSLIDALKGNAKNGRLRVPVVSERLKVRAYDVLVEAVGSGIRYGWMRSFKHSEQGEPRRKVGDVSVEHILETLEREVMNAIFESFEFDEPDPEPEPELLPEMGYAVPPELCVWCDEPGHKHGPEGRCPDKAVQRESSFTTKDSRIYSEKDPDDPDDWPTCELCGKVVWSLKHHICCNPP